ncbi:MAG: hypothetical protein GWN47_07140 [Woeseiaceae bacterium]|nr:hypothetical protein [Woeseiaceae bacterium]
MSEKNPFRVFVSHAFSESDDYLRVFEFLESVDRFFYLNTSKPENVPQEGTVEALKDELINQIKAAEVVIIVCDVWQQNENLGEYMLDVAEANDIKALAIQPFGGIAETPDALAARVVDTLAWNERTIADAIQLQARGTDTQRWDVVDFPGYTADGPIEDN